MNQQKEKAIFSQLEFREILLTFIYKIIKGEIKSPQTLRASINKAYLKNGISQDQQKGLIMSLELDNNISTKKYTRETIYKLLESLLNEHYIKAIDYNIALNLGASRELFSYTFINSKLVDLPKEELITEEELNLIIEELNKL